MVHRYSHFLLDCVRQEQRRKGRGALSKGNAYLKKMALNLQYILFSLDLRGFKVTDEGLLAYFK